MLKPADLRVCDSAQLDQSIPAVFMPICNRAFELLEALSRIVDTARNLSNCGCEYHSIQRPL
jgi:hypothetical protein